MTKIHKSICLTAVICILFFSGQAIIYAQNTGVLREPSNSESSSPQVPSSKRRILLNIAKAVIDVLCAEYGNCTPSNNTPTETSQPSPRESRRYLTPDFSGSSKSPSGNEQRNFSFATPAGWQSYESQSSVTVAPASEYANGDLTNGVILGLFDLNGVSFETGTETYVRQLVSNNKYLKRVGWPQSNTVDNVPCMTNRMEGLSPKTRNIENVVVYTCRRSTQKLFYVVTVNSGPNANRYEEENSRVTQSISFRQ
jgi:hypothetical protein